MNTTKKWACLLAVLAVGLASFGTARAADVVVKYGGPSGQGGVIWWAPSTGTTNLHMTSNGITVLAAAPGAAVVWTNASLAITRQAVPSLTNASVALTRQAAPSMTNVVLATAVITQVVDAVTSLVTVVTGLTIQSTSVAALTNVVLSTGSDPGFAVTNVVLSNP